MKILIHGASGHMGRLLLEAIRTGEPDVTLAAAIGHNQQAPGLLSSLTEYDGPADCIIDFSNHAATASLTRYAVSRKLPLVIATTGQTEEELAMIESAAQKIPLFFSGNMSLGIALLVDLARQAARMFPNADIEIVEQHHNRKLDVPSGTALMIARAIQEVRPEATLNLGRHTAGKRSPTEIGIHSLRLGNTVGVHEVLISTGTQQLTLRHEAQDRSLFAEGALEAARFLICQAPGLYNINDIICEV